MVQVVSFRRAAAHLEALVRRPSERHGVGGQAMLLLDDA